MTLPTKPSRDIEVRGKTFRWMAKRTGAVEDGTARLTVEDPATGEVQQRIFRGWDVPGFGRHEPPRIEPGDVKQFIIERFEV